MKCRFYGDLRDGYFHHLEGKNYKMKMNGAQESPIIVYQLRSFSIMLASAVREEPLSLIAVLFSHPLILHLSVKLREMDS